MRSRERGFGWAAIALVLTGFWFAALGAWALVARSTIPAGLDGTVTAIELRHEKHPGVDDVWMVSVDAGKPRHVDRQVADLLEQGDHVRKEPWDSVLVVDGHPHTLSLSEDARTMLVFAPVVGLVSAALTLVSALRARRAQGLRPHSPQLLQSLTGSPLQTAQPVPSGCEQVVSARES